MAEAVPEQGFSERDMPAEGGAGWILFAAIVMIIGGLIRIIDAFWAFDRDDTLEDVLLWKDNLSAYGWVWLVVGLLLVVAGFTVLGGSQWARWFGVAMAVVSAVTSSLWIFQYPVWSLVHVVLATLVIYGLTTYDPREA